MRTIRVCNLLTFLFASASLHGAIEYNASGHTWKLKSGSVEVRLSDQNGSVALVYLGPTGGPSWPAPKERLHPIIRSDIGGLVAGQFLVPQELTLISQEIRNPAPDVSELVLRFKHRHLPLEIEALYTAYGDTGVFARQLTLHNTGRLPLMMELAPSLAWQLPPGTYDLDYLHKQGDAGGERQLATERLGPGERAFVNRTGRSANGYSPWFCLRNQVLGVRYAAQLAYSGNWGMSFDRRIDGRRLATDEEDLDVTLGMRFDFGSAAPLQPRASFHLPMTAFTASAGDLDDIANQLHRYQRRYVMAKTPANIPMLTHFSCWYPLGRSPKMPDMKKYVDYAAELGLESFGTDASWIVKKDGDTLYGDWRADPTGFPHGLRELADYVHAKGMKLSVWLEPEVISTESPAFREHPDWPLKYNGNLKFGTKNRVAVDFRSAELRQWTRAVVDRLVRDDKIDWLKLDYNQDVGEAFDPSGPERTGTVLYDHLRYYLEWLAQIRRDYPNLILENCSSGGVRLDLAMLSQTHTTWLSDVTTPRASVELAYGCTLEFPPEACFHWTVGDEEKGDANERGHFDVAASPGWWDFLFRIQMNGQFGISSLVANWTPELKKRAIENVTLYKRLRPVIAGSDVYHLTSPPNSGEHPTGWMALQYVSPDRKQSVVTVYRLAESKPQQTLRLRGLDPEWEYSVQDGGAANVRRGKQLATEGLEVKLDTEWRSAVIELRKIERDLF